MKCSEIQELLSAYFDDELSPENRIRVRSHIEECDVCAAEISSFEKISAMAFQSGEPATPSTVWDSVESALNEEFEPERNTTQRGGGSAPPLVKYSVALAAILLIGFLGFRLLFHGHDHKEMAMAMEYVAANIDADGITTHLVNKYGGGEIDVNEVFTKVGYRPIVSSELPDGYSVESVQLLNMPCCTCTQTACRRPDNSRFFIFEHDVEETGWFEHRSKRECTCGGQTCSVVELGDRLAATYKKGKRHITFLGLRDEKEIDLLVSQFENNS